MRGFQPAAHRAAKTSGYAGGGVVRGPGTGTSDDVQDAVAPGTYIMPADSTQQVGAQNLETMGARGFQPGRKVAVNLSNGEFKLPPEQVHAIGVQALDQMKDATHAPVRGFSPGARPPAPPEPRFFFANGGWSATRCRAPPRRQPSRLPQRLQPPQRRPGHRWGGRSATPSAAWR